VRASSPAPRATLIGRLWRDYVKKYRADLLLLVPVLATVSLIGVAYAWILKETGDRLQNSDLSVAIWAPLAIIAAAIVRAGFTWLQAVMSQGIG
jgi:ABC-type multidrug transport system fused ATPase/permease subunit